MLTSSLFLLLLCGLLAGWVLSVCPSVCSGSGGHHNVDCSSKGLTKLPRGLQHNIHFLNVSFNSLQGLARRLSHYSHLRTLDLSYNHLESYKFSQRITSTTAHLLSSNVKPKIAHP
ncbi:hypothetical protein AMECASPLE_033675 [Ameca splendens]|uniref:LRRNT domain-containing protein n=1 Tax=Ameca splendens TaxID=208324 RepID=A0ABV1AFX6_9TELE